MIAAASYNVFNGEEHLLHSLRNMRNNVDYINLVVQFTSNTGHRAPAELHDVLARAEAEKLVDTVLVYEPDLGIAPVKNEYQKRVVGLQAAKAAGVTHFMTMDCDEYYPANEFRAAKDFIEEHNIIASAVPTYLHIKRPVWRSKEPDTTCCAFLTKISAESEIIFGSSYPVPVDPTRRLHGDLKPFHFFDPQTISMRHMNLVRHDDLQSKLLNTSSTAAPEFLAKVRVAYDEWQFGKPLLFPNKPPLEIIEVADLFGIDRFWQHELDSPSLKI